MNWRPTGTVAPLSLLHAARTRAHRSLLRDAVARPGGERAWVVREPRRLHSIWCIGAITSARRRRSAIGIWRIRAITRGRRWAAAIWTWVVPGWSIGMWSRARRHTATSRGHRTSVRAKRRRATGRSRRSRRSTRARLDRSGRKTSARSNTLLRTIKTDAESLYKC